MENLKNEIFIKSIEDNKEYINDKQKLIKILNNFDDILFTNNGLTNVDGWACNMYTITLNKRVYVYYEGIGHIRAWHEQAKEKLYNGFNYSLLEKAKREASKSKKDDENDIIFHAIISLLTDANCYLTNKDVDDFVNEFGYNDNIKSVRKGEKIYHACKETLNKIKESTKIIDDDILNLYDIISL